MRLLGPAALILALVPVAAAAQPAAHLQNVRWLEGCWELTRGATRTVERWSAASGGVMTGESRSVRAGVERESEKLRLFVRGDTLVYEATPSAQRVTEFRATSTAGPEITFANPAHDFPQRIVYRQVSPDSMVARIEGDRDGRRGPVSFPFRRIACPAPAPVPAFQATGAFFAISVPNADSSRAWYVEKLGMRVTMETPRRDGTRVVVVSGGGLTVEIMERDGAVPFRTAAPGISHTTMVHGTFKAGLFVEDFDGTLARLRERGVDIARGPVPARDGQPANVIIRDNAGNLIQLFAR